MTGMRRAIFLDRDGVLNKAIIRDNKPYAPTCVSEVGIPEDVYPTLNQLKSLGYLLIVATNQPDVGRGKTPREEVEAIHAFLREQLPLDDIYTCFHDDKDKCACRKPLPGLLQAAAQKYDIVMSDSIMIGDRWKDIAAGQAAGCHTIWLQTEYDEQMPQSPDYICQSIGDIWPYIETLTSCNG